MILANTFHVVVIKNNWLANLSIPISAKAFGKNKTLRGFLVLPFFSGSLALIFSYALGPFVESHLTDSFIGLGLGLSYLISELPNSFIKRRLGIKNGEHSKKYRLFQVFVDKTDSLIGMLLFYYFATSVQFKTIVELYFIAFLLSITTSFVLHSIKLKKSF
jgi:CDP-diacylglycerol--serine O-phosphatidyltransferase